MDSGFTSARWAFCVKLRTLSLEAKLGLVLEPWPLAECCQLSIKSGLVVAAYRGRSVYQTIKPHNYIVEIPPTMNVPVKQILRLLKVEPLTNLFDRGDAEILIL